MTGDRVFAVLGPGAVGSALARGLAAAGAPVRLWARRPGVAAQVARRLAELEPGAQGRLGAARDLAEAVAGADTLLLAVSDDALGDLAGALAGVLPAAGPPPVALHTNGLHGPGVLAALGTRALPGVLHPLVPVPPGGAVALRGAYFALAGEEDVQARARELVQRLGGHALSLGGGADGQAAYHAAASLASGGLVALVDAALEPMARALGDPDLARRALVDLLRRNLDHLAGAGPEGALTGPAARGSADLVARQLEVLDLLGTAEGSASALYRGLARRMVDLARRRGSLSEDRAARVLARLGERADPRM